MRAIWSGVLAIGCPLLAACGSPADQPDDGIVHVVASTNVYGDLAATIGGDHVEVTSLLSSPSQDPHSFESDARNVLAVSRADVVIENGGGYDDFMGQLLDAADTAPAVVDAVEASGLTAPEGGELNEHVWYDVAAMRTIGQAVLDALVESAPDHADDFEQNAARLDRELRDLVSRERALAGQLSGTPVAITEPVPGYLLDSLGLQNLTPAAFSEAVEEGEDVPVTVLADTLDLFESGRVEALVYNEQTTGATTEQVQAAADDAGIPVVGVTETLPEGEHYASWMTANVDAVAAALGAS